MAAATVAANTSTLDADTITFIHHIYCQECRQEAEKRLEQSRVGTQQPESAALSPCISDAIVTSALDTEPCQVNLSSDGESASIIMLS